MGRLLICWFLLGVSLVAEHPNPPVEHWLRRWQDRLQLQDWTIDVKVVPRSQLKKTVVGHVEWYRESRRARNTACKGETQEKRYSASVTKPRQTATPAGRMDQHCPRAAKPRAAASRSRQTAVTGRIADCPGTSAVRISILSDQPIRASNDTNAVRLAVPSAKAEDRLNVSVCLLTA